MNRAAAQRIGDNLLEASRLMNDAILVAKAEASPEEFIAIRKAVGVAMGELLVEVLNHLYREHPEVKPKGFD